MAGPLKITMNGRAVVSTFITTTRTSALPRMATTVTLPSMPRTRPFTGLFVTGWTPPHTPAIDSSPALLAPRLTKCNNRDGQVPDHNQAELAQGYDDE